jgi:hypothetical protein
VLQHDSETWLDIIHTIVFKKYPFSCRNYTVLFIICLEYIFFNIVYILPEFNDFKFITSIIAIFIPAKTVTPENKNKGKCSYNMMAVSNDYLRSVKCSIMPWLILYGVFKSASSVCERTTKDKINKRPADCETKRENSH